MTANTGILSAPALFTQVHERVKAAAARSHFTEEPELRRSRAPATSWATFSLYRAARAEGMSDGDEISPERARLLQAIADHRGGRLDAAEAGYGAHLKQFRMIPRACTSWACCALSKV